MPLLPPLLTPLLLSEATGVDPGPTLLLVLFLFVLPVTLWLGYTGWGLWKREGRGNKMVGGLFLALALTVGTGGLWVACAGLLR